MGRGNISPRGVNPCFTGFAQIMPLVGKQVGFEPQNSLPSKLRKLNCIVGEHDSNYRQLWLSRLKVVKVKGRQSQR